MIASPTISNPKYPAAFEICQLGVLPQGMDLLTSVPHGIDSSGAHAVNMLMCSYDDIRVDGVIYHDHSKKRSVWYIHVVNGEIADITAKKEKSSSNHE